MKFFRKTSVAVLLTLLVIALCCVIGYTGPPPQHPQDISDAPAQQAGESGLNYYLSWIDDDAGLFSMDTTDTLARSNLSLHSNYGCLMAIQTINYLNGQDIETYAKNRFEETELGSMDMLLVIETSNQAWYLVYGGTLRPYVEESGVTPTLSSVVSNNLNASFFQGESDQGIPPPFRRVGDLVRRGPPGAGPHLLRVLLLLWRQPGAERLPGGGCAPGGPVHLTGEHLVDHPGLGGLECGGPGAVPPVHHPVPPQAPRR